MSNHLEQFVKDHREEFDSEEPSKKLWDQVEFPAGEDKAPETKIVRFHFMRWSAAAAILILIGGTIWYFNKPKTNQLPATVAETTKPLADTTRQQVIVPVDTSNKNVAVQGTDPKTEPKKTEPSAEDDAAQEMQHYASLVEIKHRQLKSIEKEEPLLYKQFAGDVNKLDSVYNTLKRQLPKNPNREQLLEAMIQNLQLQMGLLNHQLDIIKKINHSKKSAYEKAYKSV